MNDLAEPKFQIKVPTRNRDILISPCLESKWKLHPFARVLNDNSFINSRNKYVIFLANFQLNSLSLSRVSKIFNLLRKALHVNKRIILRPTARSLRPTGSFLRGGEPPPHTPPPHLRPCVCCMILFSFSLNCRNFFSKSSNPPPKKKSNGPPLICV